MSQSNLEPTMWMGKLEQVLVGRDFDKVLADPTGNMVGSRDEGERFVVSLTDSVSHVLRDLDDGRVDEAARQWAAADEDFGTGGDFNALRAVLLDLRRLARGGAANSERLYCWVCV